jgi:hypothetical protein
VQLVSKSTLELTVPVEYKADFHIISLAIKQLEQWGKNEKYFLNTRIVVMAHSGIGWLDFPVRKFPWSKLLITYLVRSSNFQRNNDTGTT